MEAPEKSAPLNRTLCKSRPSRSWYLRLTNDQSPSETAMPERFAPSKADPIIRQFSNRELKRSELMNLQFKNPEDRCFEEEIPAPVKSHSSNSQPLVFSSDNLHPLNEQFKKRHWDHSRSPHFLPSKFVPSNDWSSTFEGYLLSKQSESVRSNPNNSGYIQSEARLAPRVSTRAHVQGVGAGRALLTRFVSSTASRLARHASPLVRTTVRRTSEVEIPHQAPPSLKLNITALQRCRVESNEK